MIDMLKGDKVQHFVPILYITLLIVITLVLFVQVKDFAMVQDDHLVYFNSESDYFEADFDDLASLWKIPDRSMYIPVTFSVWYLAVNLAGKHNQASVLHLLNLFLHLLNGLLIFSIAKRISSSVGWSFLAALLFLLHPLQIEAWAYISGLRGLLSVFFALLLIMIHLRKSGFIWLVIKYLLFGLAMLSKPTIIVLPIILFFYDLVIAGKPIKPLLLRYLPYVIIAAFPIYILLRPADSELYIVPNSPLWARPFFYFDSLNFYLFKTFWPWRLAPSYARTPEYLTSKWWLFTGWIIPLVATLLLILKAKKNKIILFPWFWILIAIVPISGLIPFVYQNWSNVADRYFYFAFAGLSLFLPLFLSKLKRTTLSAFIFIGIIGLGAWSATVQLPIWKNDHRLWEHCVNITPIEEKAYLNLGNELKKKGKFEEAIAAYSTAIELVPEYAEAWLGQAIARRNMKDYSGALRDFNNVAKMMPEDPRVFFNRAFAYLGINVEIRALHDFSRAIQLDREFVAAYNNRGNLHAKSGKTNLALNDYYKTLDLDPTYLEAYNNIGNIEANRQNFRRAIDYFSQALEIDGDYGDARRNRALAYYYIRDYTKAKYDLDYLKEHNQLYNKHLYNELRKLLGR